MPVVRVAAIDCGTNAIRLLVADVETDEVKPNDEFTQWKWVTYEEGPWAETPPNVGQFAKLALEVR